MWFKDDPQPVQQLSATFRYPGASECIVTGSLHMCPQVPDCYTEPSTSTNHEMTSISIISPTMETHTMAQHTLGGDTFSDKRSHRKEWIWTNFHCLLCLGVSGFLVFWTFILLRWHIPLNCCQRKVFCYSHILHKKTDLFTLFFCKVLNPSLLISKPLLVFLNHSWYLQNVPPSWQCADDLVAWS